MTSCQGPTLEVSRPRKDPLDNSFYSFRFREGHQKIKQNASLTRQEFQSPVGLVADPEEIVRGRISGTCMTLAAEKAAKSIRSPGHDKNKRSVGEQMIELLEKEGIE